MHDEDFSSLFVSGRSSQVSFADLQPSSQFLELHLASGQTILVHVGVDLVAVHAAKIIKNQM